MHNFLLFWTSERINNTSCQLPNKRRWQN